MKTKIALTLLILLAPSIVLADSEFDTTGLPVAGSGITIVPLKSMNMSATMLQEYNAALAQVKIKGYSDEESSYPKTLVKMGKLGADDINKNTDPYDTHMKYSPAQIKLAFDYKATSAIRTPDIIGFAAGGLYLNDRGWSAIAEFFNAKDIGTCKYNINNLKVSNGAVQIAAEAVRYDINKKPTDIFVKGSINSGFIYSVSWFDNTFDHTLECANMDYDKQIIGRMIDLARNMDKQ